MTSSGRTYPLGREWPAPRDAGYCRSVRLPLSFWEPSGRSLRPFFVVDSASQRCHAAGSPAAGPFRFGTTRGG
jgi:hypothetical protein